MSTTVMNEHRLRFDPGVSRGSVDRSVKPAGALRGFVVAQLGNFKTEGRGQFNLEALQRIVEIGNATPNGLKSRFTHPNLSSDGLGSFLGRATDFFLDTTADGIPAVRADLRFAKAANLSPRGKLADYVMRLAEEDPDAISSSLVVTGKEDILDTDESGEMVEGAPPIWMPTSLSAIDIVDVGDAVDGLLSADEQEKLRDTNVRNVTKMLDVLFATGDREAIQQRCVGFVEKYLTNRFGEITLGREEESQQMSTDNRNDTTEDLSVVVTDLQNRLSETEERLRRNEESLARQRAIEEKGRFAKIDPDQIRKWVDDESLSVDDVVNTILKKQIDESPALTVSPAHANDLIAKTVEDVARDQFLNRGHDGYPDLINKKLTVEDYVTFAQIEAGEMDLLDGCHEE